MQTLRLGFQAALAILALLVAVANSAELSPAIQVPADHDQDNILTRWMAPKYPQVALDRELSGQVTLEFDIDRNGHPTNVAIVDSEPIGVFDKAVTETTSYWSVTPYLSSSCVSNFPRTRIRIDFTFKQGAGLVSAGRLMPLSDPLATKGTKESTAKAEWSAIMESGAENDAKRKMTKLRWKYITQPRYPRLHSSAEPIFGNVVARILIAPDGSVKDVDILFSSPYPEFGEALKVAASSWEAETHSGDKPGIHKILCQPLSFRPEKRR
jgi:TonB family protein